MPQSSIAADQDDLSEGRAGAALFQQPEQALDRNIHHVLGSFLAGGAMQNVRDLLHGGAHSRPIRDASLDYIHPIFGLQKAVMTQRTNTHILIRLQNARNEMAPHFAGSSGHQDALHGLAILTA